MPTLPDVSITNLSLVPKTEDRPDILNLSLSLLSTPIDQAPTLSILNLIIGSPPLDPATFAKKIASLPLELVVDFVAITVSPVLTTSNLLPDLWSRCRHCLRLRLVIFRYLFDFLIQNVLHYRLNHLL